MARFLLIVMCPSARAPPVPVRRLASSATKSPTTQNAAYVPRHIICEFFEVLFIESLARVGSGLHQYADGNASIFVTDCSVLRVLHDNSPFRCCCLCGGWGVGRHMSGMTTCTVVFELGFFLWLSGNRRWLGGNAPENHSSGLLNGFQTLA